MVEVTAFMMLVQGVLAALYIVTETDVIEKLGPSWRWGMLLAGVTLGNTTFGFTWA